MEQEHQHHQWTLHVHEEEEVEVEDAALERRKFLPHSNGNGVISTVVNDPDGSLVQKEEEHAEIGSENGNHFNKSKNSDFEAVGLGIVAEFIEAAAANGESVTDSAALQENNSVYFDKQQVNEVNGLYGVQNGDSARSVHPTNHGECEIDVQVVDAFIPISLCNEDNNQSLKTVVGRVPSSGSDLTPLHDSSDIQAAPVENFDGKTSTKEGPNLANETDNELKGYDVEAVLAKQETHDLFCPNCNSCITKRVILKKRKRSVHNVDNKAKRDKFEAVVRPKPVDGFTQEADRGDRANVTPDVVGLEQPDGNHDPEGEPEVFRCLSCFSFFIPTGKCFNLFRNDGGARQHETSQIPLNVPASDLHSPSNVPSSNANWLFSLFTPNKGKTASGQGDASLEHSRTGPAVQQNHSTPISSDMQTSSEIVHPSEGPFADTAIVNNAKPMRYTDHGHGGLNYPKSSPVESVKTEPWVENDTKSNMASGNEPLADKKRLDSLFQNDLSSIQAFTESAGDVKTREGEKSNDPSDITKTNNAEDMSSLSFSDKMVSKHGSVPLATAATTEVLVNGGKPAKDAILNPCEGKPGFPGSTTLDTPILETVQKSYSSLKQGTQSPAQSFGSAVLASGVASTKQNSVIDSIIPSKQDFTLTEKAQKDTADRKENKGGDVIVFVEGGGVESATSQTADNVPMGNSTITGSHAGVRIGEQPTTEIGEPQQWEVLKSIVYGGLVESITSLGIVSSAAGSGTAPLNIIALGLANLVGGLFMLGHNLSELKNDGSDRYQELLGHRANFWLHAVVAVLSFLIFGSVPISIYGLLISKNYYAEVKLAAVAAASVACIVLLAIGKVYTGRPPKSYIKTVPYYVTLAIAASGVSYIAGNLIRDLREKFTHSESGFANIAMPISDNGMGPKWMSY